MSTDTQISTENPLDARVARPTGLRNWLGNIGGVLDLCGVALVVCVIIVGLVGHLIAPHDPRSFVATPLEAPSLSHPFGTDNFGRDILSRVLHGARYSLVLPVFVLGSATVLGILVGAAAAMMGGVIDDLLMRITDVFFVFPYLVMALAIAAAFRPSIESTIVALSLVWWPTYARLVRAQTLRVRSLLYVEASRSIGETEIGIALRHYLPHYIGILLVQVTTDVAGVIGIGAGLSFIGLGAQPPSPEWGLLIAEARSHALTAWWTALFPGLAISLTIAGFMLTGDRVQDWVDPTRRRRRRKAEG